MFRISKQKSTRQKSYSETNKYNCLEVYKMKQWEHLSILGWKSNSLRLKYIDLHICIDIVLSQKWDTFIRCISFFLISNMHVSVSLKYISPCTIADNTTITVLMHIYVFTCAEFLWNKFWGVQFLIQVYVLKKTLTGDDKLSSKMIIN